MTSSLTIVGVDPGFTGAIAILDPKSWSLLIHDMPTVEIGKGKPVLNHRHTFDLLDLGSTTRKAAILERVASRPGQGVSATFRFGQCAGALEMALAAQGYEIFMPTPQTWKKHLKILNDQTGSMARGLATQRFPAQASLFSRVKDHGRAEAALMALWGLEVIAPKLGLGEISAA